MTSENISFTGDGSTGEYRPDPLDYEVPRVKGAGLAGVESAGELSHHEHLMAVKAGEIGSIHSWELVTAVDGPGTRMTTFLAGCPLRCLYCHNPDTMKMRDGSAVYADEIIKRIERYAPVFKASNGGVTFSGGEPLMQPAFLLKLLKAAKERGIHTAIDTSGFLGTHASDELLENVDLVLLDVKSGLPEVYEKTTGRQLEPTLKFGQRLAEMNKRIWVRFVLVPGLTDSTENVNAVADIVSSWRSVERVEVLPFHQMARDKWAELGMEYELSDVQPPSKEATEAAREIFRSRGLLVF